MLVDKDFIFPVYIYEEVLNHIKNLCSNTNKEIFGYLIGKILKWKEEIYVEIQEQIFIEDTVHSHQFFTSQIEGKAGAYEKEFQKLKKNRSDDNLRVVGWWHSHPGIGCFLSRTDISTQKYFFPEVYQVALVVDPIKDEFKFFTLEKISKKKYKSVSNAIISSKS
ncbi:MAG: Mov34/MPN/PAD-1 family protein [Candidatus Hermodarchaeota archaeon]